MIKKNDVIIFFSNMVIQHVASLGVMTSKVIKCFMLKEGQEHGVYVKNREVRIHEVRCWRYRVLKYNVGSRESRN